MKSTTAKVVFNTQRLIGSSLFVLFLLSTALAQETRAPVETPREPVASGPLVTATATAKRVRFVSPGTVVQLRLEVYNETGQKLFDTELHGGNVLDWHLQDGAGQHLSAGSYACVLTIKSLSGRLSQRVGLVTVSDKKAAIETAGAAQLSLAQQQTIGPVEGNAAFTVLQQTEAEAITTVTHDGNDGQMARTRGALSFRVGDFFSGKDKEQMRLTAEGNLGIGTSKPEVTLDVAGMIRAREGLMFSDGSTLKVNEKGVLTRTSADGLTPKSVTTTTQNKIAKFIDNAGTVGDSVITESVSGFIGVGAASPQSLLQVGPNTGYGSTTGLLVSNNLIGSQFDRAFQLAPRQTANPATNSILMYVLPTVNTAVTVPSQYGLFVDVKQGPGAITSYAAVATGQNPSLGASNNTHLLMGTAVIPAGNFAIFDNTGHTSFFKGNVGIGTSSPNAATKLDVVGDINTSTQYRIGGNRVFSAGINTFAGLNAGLASTGGPNSFFGNAAGQNNTTGSLNSFFGFSAGVLNTTGATNSFFGSTAGFSNTTGNGNSFFGAHAGERNTTGPGNSFFGASAGAANTQGTGNSFFGVSAGEANTTGHFNSFFGKNAGAANTTGFNNSFFGQDAGAANTTAGFNSFFGVNAGTANTTGERNSFFGHAAGVSNTTGGSNSFFGKDAGAANTTGSSNSFFGKDAGERNTTGSFNSFFGNFAGSANTTGASNSFFGNFAGSANTTGANNSIFGDFAGSANTTGDNNSFFGSQAGNNTSTGGANSFFGHAAGFANTTGVSNAFFGFTAGLRNTTGGDNSFFGTQAGNDNTTGGDNSFFGDVAGFHNTTGPSNSFFGSSAGLANTTGGGNSFFGRNAGNANTTGGSNLVIGNFAGGNLTTGNDNIYLASSPGTNESNSIRIGTEGIQTRAFIAGISGNTVASASGTTVFVDAFGRLGTILSSRRFKQDIRAMGYASSKLMQLRPVTFRYKPEVVAGEQALQYGLIAEEVAKIYPDLVQYAADGQPQTVRYHLLNTMLLNEVQKQEKHIQSQAHQLATQSQQMTRQAQQISSLETRLRRLETRASRRQNVRRGRQVVRD